MHPFFAPLSEWELGVLLTTLTVGGAESLAILAHLSGAPAARVQEKAQALLQIAADKRIPLMVRELRDGLSFGLRRGIERVDPSWLVDAMRGESPRVVALILLSLPTTLTRSVLRRLPPAIRQALPPRQAMQAVAPAVAHLVRHMFEQRFAPMPAPPNGPSDFHGLVQLERADLFRLTRDVGLVELAQAFVTVGKMALVELCRRLPRQHAEELIYAVRVASQVDLPDPKSAQRFLSKVVVNFENTEEFLQKSGLWRLAKASLLGTPAQHQALMQRLPRRAGLLLGEYIERAQALEGLQPDVLQRLQDSVLVRVVLLARAGQIAASWEHSPMAFFDPAAAQAAMAQPAMGAAAPGAGMPEGDDEPGGPPGAPPA